MKTKIATNSMIRIKFLLMVFSLLLISCGTADNGLEKKVKDFLAKRHNIQITDFHMNINRNAGNLFDKEFSYSGYYTSKELGYRKAGFKLYNDDDGIKLVYDSYLQNKIGVNIDQKIEQNLTNVDFVIYVQVMDMLNPEQALLNQDINVIKEALLKNRNITTKVLVSAPDLKKNRNKYLQFHIDIMRELKSQKVEKCKLHFEFFDESVNVKWLRTDTQTVTTSPEANHMIERWYSIHHNKWYDMVKNRPDKVLKYGKVFTYK